MSFFISLNCFKFLAQVLEKIASSDGTDPGTTHKVGGVGVNQVDTGSNVFGSDQKIHETQDENRPDHRAGEAGEAGEQDPSRQDGRSNSEYEEKTGRIREGTGADGAVSSDEDHEGGRSTRRSTPLSMKAGSSPKTFDEMQLSGSPHMESPTFVSDPPDDVMNSLAQIGKLVRTSHRNEKRMARIEVKTKQ